MNVRLICILIYFIFLTIPLFSQSNSVFDSIPKNDVCNLKLERFVDRKLYVSTNTIADGFNVLLGHKVIQFRKSAKTISIYLPAYIDKIQKSYIHIYSTNKIALCNELIIVLKYGKPEGSTEAIPGLPQNEVEKINLPSKDTIIETLKNVRDTIFEKEKKPSILPNWISVYVDVYYARYNDSVGGNNFQKFTSISPRSNTIGLNTAQINFQYDAEKIRAAAAFHYGDFAKTTWLTEFNNIMEAHAGLRLSKKLWIDAGFFRTHLGTEGLLPRENICSSLAIGTIYEPAFISGIRFNYLPSAKWNINLYFLNSFNGFVDNNDKKSIGMLVTYFLNENSNIGFSNYLGDDTPENVDSISHLRFHQNIYFNYQYKKLKLQLGADFCLQQNSDLINPTKTANMLSGLTTASYSLSKLISIYSRIEYFNDRNGFMSAQFTDAKGKLTGYKLWGLTTGLELKPLEKFFIRLEGRRIQMDEDQLIFRWNGINRNYRSEIMLNMGISY